MEDNEIDEEKEPQDRPIVKCSCGTESQTLYYYGYCPDCGEWRDGPIQG